MSDCYNSKFARFIGRLNGSTTGRYAVTISKSCTCYAESQETVSATHRRHEDWHKHQIADEGWLKFMIKYFFFNMTRGYRNNPYEIEARRAETIPL